MSAVLNLPAYDQAEARREKARAAARRTREALRKGDFGTVVKDAQERFPNVLARLAE
jgi:hypothetical protein